MKIHLPYGKITRLIRRGLLPIACLTIGCSTAVAQLSVTGVNANNADAALSLVNNIKGTGIQSVSNASLTAVVRPGVLKLQPGSSAGTFGGGASVVGLQNGIVLSSGGVNDLLAPNFSSGITQSTGTGFDLDLEELVDGTFTYDKAILEFDFVANYPTLAFRYVFGSDEYNEFTNSDFSDIFAIFVNGVAAENNIARIHGSTTAVSIATVNGGNPLGVSPQNAAFYVDNSNAEYDVEFDGFTVVLTAQLNVTPGATNHIKIAIADVGDDTFDSSLLIEEGSFVSGNAPIASADRYHAARNGSLTVGGSGVLSNDTDADMNLATAQLIKGPTKGTLDLAADGTFTYTPQSGYAGPDSFTYQAVDATNLRSNVATVTFAVGNVRNAAPTSGESSISVAKNAVSTLPLSVFLFDDTDANNALSAVTIDGITAPDGALLQIDGVDVVEGQTIPALVIANGGLKFTPVTDMTGPEYATLSYKVSDGVGQSSANNLIINVFDAVPEIAVSGNGADVANGSDTVSVANDTDFGPVTVVTGVVNRTFTITNEGTASLNLGYLEVSGEAAQDFDITTQPAATVQPGDSTTVSVQFVPSVEGARTATLAFKTNDGDESEFSFLVEGLGVGTQDIAVEQPAGAALTDGAGTVNCGSSNVTIPATRVVITVRNTGSSNLVLGPITIDGTNAADFAAAAPDATTIPAYGTATFAVTFTPSQLGAHTADLHIASNDPDEDPFDITLTGTGLSGGVISIDGTFFTGIEEGGTINVPLVRTGSTSGAVSVLVSTSNGSALAPTDYTALVNKEVSFGRGQSVAMAAIPVIADSFSELNERFTVTISGPIGGASLGTQTTATVRILDPDAAAPTIVITSPTQNAQINEGVVTVSGQGTDTKEIETIEMNVNGAGWVQIPFTPNTNGTIGRFSTTISPTAASNVVQVRATDPRGNVSNVLSRNFNYNLFRALPITIIPAGAGTVTVSPLLTNGQAKIGTTYTFTAAAKNGSFFNEWTVPGVVAPQSQTTPLTLVFAEGLTVDANFIVDPFAAGAFAGLAVPTTGVTPSAGNTGYVSATLSILGKLTTQVNFGGVLSTFVATIDARTGDSVGASGNLAYNLHLDLTGGGNVITGIITNVTTNEISDVVLDRAAFSAANPVPAQFLRPANANGYYTATLPARASQPGLTTADYPQGDGALTLTLTPAGILSTVGALADGTSISASAPMSSSFAVPLAAFVKATNFVPGTTLAGKLQFDTTPADTDVTGTDMLWIRTARAASTNYPAGWPSSIGIDLIGAHFTNPAGEAALAGLGAVNPGGNATLECTEGLLVAPFTRNCNITTANLVSKIPANDLTYTLSIMGAQGTFSGSLTHPAQTSTVKPLLRGVILRKGANAGGFGYFLSPDPAGAATAQGGAVTLLPQ